MTQIDLRGVTFNIDESRGGDAFFMMGVRKSGSSMFFKIARALALHNDYNYVDIAGTLFHKNIKVGEWVKDPALSEIIKGGNVYAGFRNFPAGVARNPVFLAARKVLLVRDPRDALVSEYFSNAYSHSLPKATSQSGARENLLAQREIALATPIDDYVSTRARMLARTLGDYKMVLGDEKLLLLKYEDIIFRKEEMIQDLVRHFGWECSPAKLREIVASVDVVPSEEVSTNFIRKVVPGDHKEKLTSATIDKINRDLASVLRAYGYT